MGMGTTAPPLRAAAVALALAAVVMLDAAAAWSRAAVEARALMPFVVGAPSRENCEPAYPTVCLPPPPPDLDCPQVLPLVNFQALPADPHGLDADQDGIACESP